MPKSVQRPTSLTLRAYQVGFGDCFLLTFHYPKPTGNRHILIDFGSTARPDGYGSDLLLQIARDIVDVCDGKLHAVVATHRHKDHISGFATAESGEASGDLIASCQPDLVLQPWTEDPAAAPDAKAATTRATEQRALAKSLDHLHAIAEHFTDDETLERLGLRNTAVGEQLAFLGEDNLTNRSAVENLIAMGEAAAKRIGKRGGSRYLRYGDDTGLENILPNVNVHVLGPPDLTQSDRIRKQRSEDAAEFWQLQAATASQFQRANPLFPNARKRSVDQAAPFDRWFIKQLQDARADQLLEIVRALDDTMNNTSLILLFEAGDKKLLFPGDAQIENWSYALNEAPDSANARKLLADVNLYKVGHHGSRNATPITLWNLFKNRGPEGKKERLTSVVSTMAGKHGSEDSKTEVPRRTLVAALQNKSTFITTQELAEQDLLRKDINITP